MAQRRWLDNGGHGVARSRRLGVACQRRRHRTRWPLLELAIVVSGKLRFGQQTLSRLDTIGSTSGAPNVVALNSGNLTTVAIVRSAQAASQRAS
jgi:hypothetical protein